MDVKIDGKDVKTDSNEFMSFFKRQLEFIKPRSFDTRQRMLKAAQLIPVSTEAGPGTREITFRRFTDVGQAKIIGDYATDIPRADVYGEEETIKVKHIASSYGYSIFEILQSRKAGANLDVRRAQSCNRTIDQKLDRLVWFGDTTHNVQGFLDYPGIQEYVVPNGTSGFPTWATKTPEEILTDLNSLMSVVRVTTNGVEIIDTIIMPIASHEIIRTRRNSDSSDLTIKEYFLRNNPGITIEELDVLAGAGAGDTNRIMGYFRNPSHVTQEMPVPRAEDEPVRGKGQFEVMIWADHAGVIVYYPLSVIFADGI